MNKIKLLLTKVDNADLRKRKDGSEYIRVTFEAFNGDNDTIMVKTSMSENQWKDLKNSMEITFNAQELKIETGKTVDITFDKDGKTNGQNPKPLYKLCAGDYQGHIFNYWELNVGALIQNNVVVREAYKSDLTKLF